MPPLLTALLFVVTVLLPLPSHPEEFRERGSWDELAGHTESFEPERLSEELRLEGGQPKAMTQSSSGMGDDVEQWRPLVAGHFGDLGVEAVDRVMCIMRGESGGNPSARNPSGASGLMQVMPFWASEFGLSRQRLFEPEINLWVARQIYEMQGWSAWSVYNRGSC